MKTDTLPIKYPQGLSASDRRFCRRLICAVSDAAVRNERIIVSCSGGIDSTVLVHALGQALRIRPNNTFGVALAATALYINHNLRADEVDAEARHVEEITRQHLTFSIPPVELNLEKGSGLQERARQARYDALADVVANLNSAVQKKTAVWMAHSASDNAETKLFQFLNGRPVLGIPRSRIFGTMPTTLERPLLSFSRLDIERYAKCFGLKWCEDSSNGHDDYTRNKIRHHLIPWIEKEINPGFIEMLNKEN